MYFPYSFCFVLLSANLYGGYTFKDKVNFDAAYTEVQDGFQWGVGLEYFTSSRTSIELKYLRMDTRFPLYNPQGDQVNTGNDDGNLQYILLGGNQYFPKNGSRFTPFIGGALGVGIVGGEADNATKFGWDARAGVTQQNLAGMPGRGLNSTLNLWFHLSSRHIYSPSYPLSEAITGLPVAAPWWPFRIMPPSSSLDWVALSALISVSVNK